MSGIVIDENKVRNNVIPNLEKISSQLKKANEYAKKTNEVLPINLSCKFKMVNIINQIDNSQTKIQKTKTLILAKLEKAKKIEALNKNRALTLSNTIAKIAGDTDINNFIKEKLRDQKNGFSIYEIFGKSARKKGFFGKFSSIYSEKKQSSEKTSAVPIVGSYIMMGLLPEVDDSPEGKLKRLICCSRNKNIEELILELNKIGYITEEEKDKKTDFMSNIFSAKSTFEMNGNKYIFENGKCCKIEYANGLVTKIGYEDDEIISIETKNGGIFGVNIFGGYNIETNQYGGDQGSMTDNADKLLDDAIVLNILKEAYPGKTLEDYELYLKKITNTGCGYTALVNTIFKEYQGKEDEFEEKFGYPMYTVKGNGTIDYNYEYIIIDTFTEVWKDEDYTFDEIISGMETSTGEDAAISKEETKVSTGTNYKIVEQIEDVFNEKYEIDVNMTSIPMYQKAEIDLKIPKYLSIEGLKNATAIADKYDAHVILTASGYDLYTMNGDLYYEDGGGHAMYITDIDSEGNIIVSSWGKQFIVDLENADRIGYYLVDYN